MTGGDLTPQSYVWYPLNSDWAAVRDPEFKSAMTKMETPIAYLDAPDFQKFWDKDAKMLADAIKRVEKIEKK